VTQYLSISKPDPINDEKHLQRSNVFRLARENYLGFLDGLIGSEENAIAYFLDSFTTSSTRGIGEEERSSNVPGGPADEFVAIAQRDRKEESRLKNMLKLAQSHLNPAGSNLPHNLSLPAISSQPLFFSPSAPRAADTTVGDGFGVPVVTRRREGFLWATKEGAPHSLPGDGGGGWHKFWCVLSNGRLTEYSHFKTKPTVNNTAIDLRYAAVRRSSSQHSDRRFLFDVLTPTERRVYQAISQNEAEAWITSITKSIESLLVGNSSMRVFDESKLTGGLLSLKSFASASTPSLIPTSSSSSTLMTDVSAGSGVGGLAALSGRLLGRRVSTGARKLMKRDSSKDNSKARPSTAPVSTIGAELLPPSPTGSISTTISSSSPSSTLSEADRKIALLVNDFAAFTTTPSAEMKGAAMLRNGREIARLATEVGNCSCAECQQGQPDWTSYSLGIFLCLRCAGIHRSLGTVRFSLLS
jgi:hypothetical protein